MCVCIIVVVVVHDEDDHLRPLFFLFFFHRVALRKNGKTLVTAMSEDGGFSPVSQATLAYLRSGDVVQLVSFSYQT